MDPKLPLFAAGCGTSDPWKRLGAVVCGTLQSVTARQCDTLSPGQQQMKFMTIYKWQNSSIAVAARRQLQLRQLRQCCGSCGNVAAVLRQCRGCCGKCAVHATAKCAVHTAATIYQLQKLIRGKKFSTELNRANETSPRKGHRPYKVQGGMHPFCFHIKYRLLKEKTGEMDKCRFAAVAVLCAISSTRNFSGTWVFK
ncbi:hypothetical protein GGX14DRAFT_405251 [Mycena pura]|uniref:Uncharacterized protein n=1 Tax=Mycena pura TaxID=153505 RepID=A0AAD6UWB8_9AGAR|nr:hypothetical protein GGX14DRAFT_405251 [Mycena pura]